MTSGRPLGSSACIYTSLIFTPAGTNFSRNFSASLIVVWTMTGAMSVRWKCSALTGDLFAAVYQNCAVFMDKFHFFVKGHVVGDESRGGYSLARFIPAAPTLYAADSRHGGRHAARWPGTRRKWRHLKPIKCGDSFRIRLKATLGITPRIGRFGKKLWNSPNLRYTYCSDDNVEYHISAAVWGRNILVNWFSWVLPCEIFKRPSVTWVWCRNVCSFRSWDWKVKYIFCFYHL